MSGETDRFERSAAFLQEMGLGPLWVRRAVAPKALETTAVQVPETVPEAVRLPVQESAQEPTQKSVQAPAQEPAREPLRKTIEEPAQEKVPGPTPAEVAAEAPVRIEPAWDDEPALPAGLDSDWEPELVPFEAIASEPAGPRISDMGWDELEQTVSDCTRCGLCRGRTRTVFGTGARTTRWLFIGEGPGREEDLRGEPFVGRAGQLLDNMLAALGLARADNAYIANIVKCRPTDERGKDRRPSPEEVAVCLPYLKRQIELIQPEVIVALGKTAAVSLLGLDPETPVSGLRGKVHRYQERPLVVTYHPAYLLRTPADKRKAWADLCLARETLA